MNEIIVNTSNLEAADANAVVDGKLYVIRLLPSDITADEITALTDAIQTFKELPSPEQMKAIRKQFTSELKALIKKANNIIIDSLDGLMYQLHGTAF